MTPKLTQISSRLITLHRDYYQESPTPMKLQKLCYYAQGYNLAIHNAELFPEDFEAWVLGPVIPELYQEYKNYGYKSIDKEFVSETLSPEAENILDTITQSYGRYDGASLSTMTHQEEPWKEARRDLKDSESSNNKINKPALKQYFASILSSNNAG